MSNIRCYNAHNGLNIGNLIDPNEEEINRAIICITLVFPMGEVFRKNKLSRKKITNAEIIQIPDGPLANFCSVTEKECNLFHR